MFKPDNFKSKIIVRAQLPFYKLDPDTHFLLYDKQLESLYSEEFDLQDFVESFPHRLGLKAGEPLKSFRDFPKNLETVLKPWPQPVKRSHTLVALGGGSLGDFAGFVASILKRGVGLIHIPSTWLAAMDSAHGGKNALNMAGAKNQIGTFYPAQKVFVVKELLESSPRELKEQAYGELIKMALIGESQFFREIIEERRPVEDFMWRFMKNCIEDKYHVILQDPYESKTIRQTLNFGHSLGHALESHFEWPHGDSVLQGIFFSLEWSRYRGLLSQVGYDKIMSVISEKFSRGPAYEFRWYRKPALKAIERLLLADKKINDQGQLNFVFLKGVGKPSVQPVLLTDLLSEAKRQGWIK
ncbi:MAG: 3-dehydroquinate synthase [Bdellovibrionales bacterium]|nr:3-dehydroquinate synthase [Bdellovibrionales bacterium]